MATHVGFNFPPSGLGGMPGSRHTPDASDDFLGNLFRSIRNVWERPEDMAGCIQRLLASLQREEELLRRLLMFVEALREPLLERLQRQEAGGAGDDSVDGTSRKKARSGAASDLVDGRGGATGEGSGSLIRAAQSAGPVSFAVPGPQCVDEHEGMLSGAKGVLLDRDLLDCVLGFVLGGSGRQDVAVLGQLSLVCLKWRQVCACGGAWGHIEQELLPVLWDEGPGEGKAQAGSSSGIGRGHERVVHFGRWLQGQRDVFKGVPICQWHFWLERLVVDVEIFDRYDGLKLLAMHGPTDLQPIEGDHGQIIASLSISTESERSVIRRQMPFSAASRDPLGRFRNIVDYFTLGHLEEYPCCLCVL